MILKLFREPWWFHYCYSMCANEPTVVRMCRANCQYGLWIEWSYERKTFVGSHPSDMATYWLKHKLLVDSKVSTRAKFYYADITFDEDLLTNRETCLHHGFPRAVRAATRNTAVTESYFDSARDYC
jgi:hypothetical protein